MNWTWLRGDPAIRSLYRWIPLVAINLFLFLGLSSYLQVRFRDAEPGWMTWNYVFWLLIVWGILLGFLLSSGSRERCGSLEMSLPVPAGGLWIRHLVAILIGGTAILGTAGGLIALIDLLMAHFLSAGRMYLEPGLTVLLSHLGGGLILGAVILQGAQPSLGKTPILRGLPFRFLLCSIGLPILLLLLSGLPASFALVLPGVAAVLGYRSYRALPDAFVLFPGKALPGGTAAAGAGRFDPARERPGRLAHSRWWLYPWIYRSLTVKPNLAMVAFLFTFVMGIFLSNMVTVWLEEPALRPTFTIMYGFFLLSMILGSLNQLHVLDTLPISRQRLFAILVLPGLGALSLGYGAGTLGTALWGGDPESLIRYREKDSRYHLYVPFWACEITWDGSAPEIGSPWGESHRAASTTTLFRGGRAALYSPFSTPAGSSEEFVALQMSRAVEAVYGRVIPPAEIRERLLEVDERDRVVPKGAELDLLDAYPDLVPPESSTTFPLLFLLVGWVFFFELSLYLRTLRAGVSGSARKLTFLGLLVLTLGLHFGQYALLISGWIHYPVAAAFVQIGIRNLTGALPGGGLVIWIFSGLALLGAYRLVQNRFLRVEAPVVECKPFWLFT